MNQFYLIHCRTHLHVGSGDSNYGVIDKMVQRDPTDKLPCVFASSLKGAFRQYFEEVIEKDKPKGEKVITESIFGDGEKGKVIFHQGYILSIPVRSNKYPYFNSTSPICIDQLIENLILIMGEEDNGVNDLVAELVTLKTKVQQDKVVIFGINKTNLKIEEFESADIVSISEYSPSARLISILGDRVALFDDDSFKLIVSDYHLPVIARNYLENGQSKNLWYEQIIPRDSRFFFATTSIIDTDFFDYFNEGRIIQIGANATIGYGLTKVTKLI